MTKLKSWINSKTVNDKDLNRIGLENIGNSCYCNSIIQSLYHCKSFRDSISNSHSPNDGPKSKLVDEYGSSEEMSQGEVETKLKITTRKSNEIKIESDYNLFQHLHSLFNIIATAPKKVISVSPSKFMNKVGEENEMFRGTLHQDAHEFFQFLINGIHNPNEKKTDIQSNNNNLPKTWLQQLFEGVLTNETKCLTCEESSNREETFFDLSVDIEHNSSLSYCMRNFCASEYLNYNNKFYCEHCCSLQEAEKRLKIKKSPQILVMHLKNDMCEDEKLYKLTSFVVHIGSGPNHGHYISIVKQANEWVLYDDDRIEVISEDQIDDYYGDNLIKGCGYIFFYENVPNNT